MTKPPLVPRDWQTSNAKARATKKSIISKRPLGGPTRLQRVLGGGKKRRARPITLAERA